MFVGVCVCDSVCVGVCVYSFVSLTCVGNLGSNTSKTAVDRDSVLMEHL